MAPLEERSYGIMRFGLGVPPPAVSPTDPNLPTRVEVVTERPSDVTDDSVQEWAIPTNYDLLEDDIFLPLCAGWYLVVGLLSVSLFYIHLRLRFGPLLKVSYRLCSL